MCKQENMTNLFPNSKFTVCMDIDELNKILTDKTEIIIKCVFNCHCYKTIKRDTEYYLIKGNNMTYKYIINQLINQNLDLEDCDHQFIEGFDKTSECQYELITGS
jgi:hypothetical protein